MGGAAKLPITADLVARAIVAAAMAYGDDPSAAMTSSVQKARRCLMAAGSGLKIATGVTNEAAAKLVGVKVNSFKVARVQKRGAFAKAEAAVLRALDYAGWRPECAASKVAAPTPAKPEPSPPVSEPAAALLSPPAGNGKAAEPKDRPNPARSPVGSAVSSPAPEEAQGRGWKAPLLAVDPGFDGQAAGVEASPYLFKRQGRRTPRVPPRHTATRLRHPTGRTLRYARRFLVARWPLDEIADLFDCDAAVLGRALGL